MIIHDDDDDGDDDGDDDDHVFNLLWEGSKMC